ncbi:MAG: sigma-70 family RNA polymerase sigma factor [Bacteroides sp.]|nr:sigma-70 family RNA polymerase sigma factor [Eubacterium sp.]MCM1417468.1 sigma-70 family RNA polymerase sigma factor [Roseburia sp.]MCM1461648.1 sigma-70 family RNA polymerase sigma factor [Bacteroides sp.]
MDSQKFTALVKAYRAEMYKIAFCQTRNHADAEDVTQEAFLRLFRYEKSFASDEDCKAWLIRVTINCAKDLMKSHWYRFSRALAEAPLLPKRETEKIEENELIGSVMRLGKKYRTVLFLFYYSERSVNEIADALGISPSTVTTRLSRGRDMLKKILESENERSLDYVQKRI